MKDFSLMDVQLMKTNENQKITRKYLFSRKAHKCCCVSARCDWRAAFWLAKMITWVTRWEVTLPCVFYTFNDAEVKKDLLAACTGWENKWETRWGSVLTPPPFFFVLFICFLYVCLCLQYFITVLVIVFFSLFCRLFSLFVISSAGSEWDGFWFM